MIIGLTLGQLFGIFGIGFLFGFCAVIWGCLAFDEGSDKCRK